ncbi:regulator, partial [Salmonella enterica subsp. enterica serovar Typhimurium]|nr:regulator [Salmonella enterica subsp. enterica serovar Typhimurium]
MSECFTSGSLSRWVKARHMALAGY